jgi:hypothetical protein
MLNKQCLLLLAIFYKEIDDSELTITRFTGLKN